MLHLKIESNFLFQDDFFWLWLSLCSVTRVCFHLTFDCQNAQLLTAQSVCLCSLIEGPRAYQQVMSPAPPDSLSGLRWGERARCERGWRIGLALLATNQPVKQARIFKGRASPPSPTPWWFTAPTEARLGTATVSAPGPLSGGQDELFAEDIQMYKEQIRLTQSSFAPRDRKKKKKKRGTGWLQKDPSPSASWMSERVGGMKTALCIQSANSQLIPLIHSWSTFNCVGSHSKDMFVAFNWRPLWNHSNV